MKLISNCMRCLQENGVPNLATFGLVAIPDDGVIRLECVNGHTTHTVLQQDRFELLSELAVTAIMDGYYRDAIGSFTASLERLFEFYLRSSLSKRAVPEGEVAKSWKELRNSSERQLGAFVTIWIADHGVCPQLPDQQTTALRNSVIHKGKFPSRVEAIAYGQSIANVVTPILAVLHGDAYIDVVRNLTLSRLNIGYQAARKLGTIPSTYSHTTVFSLNQGAASIDVESAVAERVKRPSIANAISSLSGLATTPVDERFG